MHEDNFILNAARLNLSEENIAALKKIPKKNIDWPLFEKKARAHGVDTFIYYSLKNHNLSELIPPETYKRFQKHYYEVAYQNSVFIDEVDKISAIIDDKIVLLKGIDLIQSLYPNIAIRSMVDIDILVDSEKDVEIWDKLKINGFAEPEIGICKSSSHRERPTPKSNERFHNLPGLSNGKFYLEVHWNIFQREQFSDETKMAWDKAVPIDFNKKLSRLSSEFLLVHLCCHLYFHKHQFVLLRMICDINELIIKQNGFINWEEVNEIGAKPELKNALTTALTYAHVLLQTPVPENFFNNSLIIEKTITLDVLLSGDSDKSHFSHYLAVLKSIGKPSDQIKFVFRTIVPSREWMNENYQAQSGIKLVMAYMKYWLFQLNTNIIRRGIRNGN
jgi:hypothetical protein